MKASMYPVVSRITRTSLLASSPMLYRIYARWLRPEFGHGMHPWSVPDKHTDLVMEEAGACGNHSLATYFERHNPGVRLATLTHCAAPVIYAVRHGIPCIVLTRDIVGYVDSCMSRMSDWYTPAMAMRCYCSFFRAVMPYRNRFVTATLEDICEDPRNVMTNVNVKFGTEFNVGNGMLPRIRHTSGAKQTRYTGDGQK